MNPAREITKDVAIEIAAMVRENNAGNEVNAHDIWLALCRMLASDASTPVDALALITTARKLFNSIELTEGSIEAVAQMGAMAMLLKASDALERATGERAATFAGYEWH